jgi:uncharacterized protein DUF3551
MRSLRQPFALAFVLAGAAVLAGLASARAQSAYDYPWCAMYTNKSGAQACYYTSREQCMATMRGIGGTCIESPYYRGPARPERRVRRN